MRSSDTIVVYGASGLVGQRVCAELAASGATVIAAGRNPEALARLGLPIEVVKIAQIHDAHALARAFASACVVVNAAGPLRETAAPVLVAALAAGAHYVDVGGEQAVLQTLYERHESTARRAGLVAMPGAGLDCTIGDLAAAWAATHVCGIEDTTPPMVRLAPAARLAEDRPLDDVAVTYIYDQLALSAGSQRTLFGQLGARALVWRRDRWEAAAAGQHRQVHGGPDMGERDAISYAGGDVITVPRHLAAQLVTSYVSTTSRPATSRAMRLVARALPFVPRAATDLLVAYAAPDVDYTRTRFAVVTQVRRGFSAAQVAVTGHDPYRTTAAIAAWVARQLAVRRGGPSGMRTPAELFHAASALREIATAAELSIDPSFG